MLAGPGSHPTFARTHPSIYARRYLLQSGKAMTHNRLEVVLHEPRLNRRLPDPAFGGGRGGGRPDRRPRPVATLLAFLSPGVHTVNRGSRAQLRRTNFGGARRRAISPANACGPRGSASLALRSRDLSFSASPQVAAYGFRSFMVRKNHNRFWYC